MTGITPRTHDELGGQSGVGVPIPGRAELTPLSLAPPQPTLQAKTIAKDPLRPEKAAIIGTAPSSRMVAPYADPSWTIWGTSPGNIGGVLPRVDAWFEIHADLVNPENASYGPDYAKWLSAPEQTGRFPTMANNSLIERGVLPHAIRFPHEELIVKFGKFHFTSTFAWCIAYAIHVGVKELGLYGVDMASRDEYILQRAGGQHFIQVARDHGIKVHVPPESDLAQPPPLYGFSEGSAFGRKAAAREQEVKGRIAAMEQQQQQLAHGLAYLKGALEDIDYWRQIWGGIGG